MGWLSNFFERDKYEFGIMAKATYFSATGMFTATTKAGYEVPYELYCSFLKTNHSEFKVHGMLEDGAEYKFLDQVNRTLVRPLLQKKGRFFTLSSLRGDWPELHCVVTEKGIKYVFEDVACIELNQDLRSIKFERFGCTIDNVRLTTRRLSEDLIVRNYNLMRKLYNVDVLKNMPEYRAAEETAIITIAHRKLELLTAFHRANEYQEHKGERLKVSAQVIENIAEIKWRIEKSLSSTQTIRGYRREEGFWTGDLPLENNGVCIADSRINAGVSQTMIAGHNSFFTFIVIDRVTGKEVIVETIRFSIRSASDTETNTLTLLKKAISAKLESPPTPIDERRVKTDKAMHELLSFVEFDESISQIEKELIDRISSKDYSVEEREEKIERLKAVVESLRIDNM